MRLQPSLFALVPALAIAMATNAMAVTLPYVEEFPTDNANWGDSANSDLTYHASGGPDGSSYVSADFNFKDSAGGAVGSREASTLVIRGRTFEFPGFPSVSASDGEFFGNWLHAPVDQFSVMVRHDAPEPLSYFVRFATGANFPGIAANLSEPVDPGVWTELVVPIDPTNPQFAIEGVPYPAAFPNVGRIQIGVYAPTSLAGVDQEYHFDIDKVSIAPVPEPTSIAMLSAAAVGLFLLRNRKK